MKNLSKQTKSLVGLTMIVSLFLSPAMSFAKEKTEKENDREDKVKIFAPAIKLNKTENEVKKEKSNKKDKEEEQNECFKAFGRLIASGWTKNHGPVTVDKNCQLPFGIDKKFSDERIATTSPDTIAPIISNLRNVTDKQKTIITWSTNELSDSSIFWGTTTPVIAGNTGVHMKKKSTRELNHRVAISGLNASTTYFGFVRSRDKSGNTATSSTFSFKTN